MKHLYSRSPHIIAIGALLALTLYPLFHTGVSAQSQTCTAPPTEKQNGANAYWSSKTTIKVWIGSGFSASEVQEINTAMSQWGQTSGLTSYGITFQPLTGNDPVTSSGAPPANTVRIYNDPSSSPNNLAYTKPYYYQTNGVNTNQLAGANVAFNKGFQFNGANGPTLQYDPNGANASSFFTSVVLHELGHVLGLDDAPAPIDPYSQKPNPCLQTAGATIMNGTCGTNDNGDGGR